MILHQTVGAGLMLAGLLLGKVADREIDDIVREINARVPEAQRVPRYFLTAKTREVYQLHRMLLPVSWHRRKAILFHVAGGALLLIGVWLL